ncbi:MAG: diguanylate cyclase [Acidobacteria bacterium]|nr:MAG: diguanylate cyclase [Acidobacteriota bacterium]REK08412.1 MAG: diguanylate cyclase [Acidobacteriota bacterium]
MSHRDAPLRLALVVLIGVTGCAGTQRRDAPPPQARGGVLDARQWSPERDGPLELAGEWRFHWQELLAGDDAARCFAAAEEADFAEVPHTWDELEREGAALPAEGFATYCLTVLLAERDEPLMIYVPRLRTASDLWVDGIRVAQSGRVGTSRGSSLPRRIDHVSAIAAAPRIELMLRVSNYHFRSGGPHKAIRIGAPIDLEPLPDGRSAALTAFFVGAFVILGVYHVLMHPLRRRGIGPVAFGGLCLVMALYQLTRENNLFATVFPGVSWQSEIRLEYTMFALSVTLAAVFLRATYPREVSLALVRACALLPGLFVVATWALPLLLVTDQVLLAFQLCFAALGAWGVLSIARAARAGRPGASWFFVGGGLWLLTGLVDGLLLRVVPNAPRLLPFGFMALVVAQAVLLAIVQARSATRTKELSTSLLSLASEKLALEQVAYRDPLTGLDNRRRLDLDVERLREEAEPAWGSSTPDAVAPAAPAPAASTGTRPVSLLYLDVDDFKEYNDRYGHEVGDQVLIEIARILREESRPYDLSVRLGGDEFALLLVGVDEVGARAQARRLEQRLAEPIDCGGRPLRVSASIGTATVPGDQVDIGEMLRRADASMYRRKGERKKAKSA